MKLNKALMAMLPAAVLAVSGMLSSCDTDFDYPPVIVPEADIVPNTSIAELKAAYWDEARNYADTIFLRNDGEHFIIAGRVVSSDETGNIYKSLVIQDETAALAMSINDNALYESYKVGQELVIDVTGMVIGKYNGLQQLGKYNVSSYGEETSFMELETFQEHAQVNGLPVMSEVDTLTVTIPEVMAVTTAEQMQVTQSRLVRLDNVRFEDGGLTTFADHTASANRNIVDAEGNTLVVRNSNYATFAQETLPTGEGSVVGILSYYGTGWQLLLRDTNDLIGFTWSGEGGGGGDEPGEPMEATMTIADLKALYWQDATNYCMTVEPLEDGRDVIIEGTVVSDDASGNVFKYLYMMDATGAISFAIDGNDINTIYPYGQKIYVNVTGMTIGKYAGLQEIGAPSDYNGTPQVGRMSFAAFKSATKTEGKPGTVTPTDASIATILAATSAEALQQWQNRLIRLQGVHFRNGGSQAFVVGGQNTNQDLVDAQGNTIIVRTSSYADFKDMTLPSGNGNVTALLGYFNGTWQLTLNSASDCSNFDGQDTPEPPTPPTPPTGSKTFKKVSALTSGKSYVLVYNGQVGTPIQESYSYGRLALASVTISGDQLTTDMANAITLTEVQSGQWTLVDTYGRYMGTDSDASHTSNFQLYTSFGDGCTWKAEVKDGWIQMTSILRPELLICQTGTFTNIAPADTSNAQNQVHAIEFYELVD